jgi:hypothetical protein
MIVAAKEEWNEDPCISFFTNFSRPEHEHRGHDLPNISLAEAIFIH